MNKFFNIHNFAIENKMSRNTVMRELEMFLNEIENANPSMNRVLNNSGIDFKVVSVREMSIRFQKGVRGCTNIHGGTATVWVCDAGKEHGSARRSIAHEFGHLVYRFILAMYSNFIEQAWFSLFTNPAVMLEGFCMGVMDGFSYCLMNPEEGFAEVFAAYHIPKLRAKMDDNCCELVRFIDAIMEHDYSDLLYGIKHPEEVKVKETPITLETLDDFINGLESMLGMSLEDFIDSLEDE